MGLANSIDDVVPTESNTHTEIEVTFDDIDDEELDAYIMTDDEFQRKNGLWLKLNATYLEEQRSKYTANKPTESQKVVSHWLYGAFIKLAHRLCNKFTKLVPLCKFCSTELNFCLQSTRNSLAIDVHALRCY